MGVGLEVGAVGCFCGRTRSGGDTPRLSCGIEDTATDTDTSSNDLSSTIHTASTINISMVIIIVTNTVINSIIIIIITVGNDDDHDGSKNHDITLFVTPA